MKQFDITLVFEEGKIFAAGIYNVFITQTVVIDYAHKYASLN